MPCTNCMAEYSRIRKEHGCSKCAFSFCGKCVSKKFVIPVLSPKPVSVCDNCYNILTGKTNGSEPGLKKTRTDSSSVSAAVNWWGDDRLPPPSLRAQYAAELRKGAPPPPAIPVTTSQSVAVSQGTDWASLEQRLANLTCDLPSTSDAKNPFVNGAATTTKDISLAEIEERLAALKEVPIEVIRNPRLRIYDSDADENCANDDSDVGDDVARLLTAAEARAKLERRQERRDAGYDNSALEMDEEDVGTSKKRRSTSASSCSSNGLLSSSSDESLDSSVIRQTVQSALNAPSMRSSDLEDANAFHPNFAEYIENTIKDAESAEWYVAEFIRQSQEREGRTLAEYNWTSHAAAGTTSPSNEPLGRRFAGGDRTDKQTAGSELESMNIDTEYLWRLATLHFIELEYLNYLTVAMIISGVMTFLMMMVIGVRADYGRYSVSEFLAVPARLAWMVQELPSFVVPFVAVYIHFESLTPIRLAVTLLFVGHYFQRTFIYGYLIRGGKPTPFHLFLMGLLFTTWNGFIQGFYHIKYFVFNWNLPNVIISGIGLLIFFFGMAVNIHSDIVLRNLRKPGETGYKIPTGSAFEYVSCANFFGEIVEWCGYALFAQTWPAFAFALFTACNLVPRALEHHKWYLAKFNSYPRNRKAIIPLLL